MGGIRAPNGAPGLPSFFNWRSC